MADYTQTTFFGPKDALTPGDPLKIIKGTDFDPEFSAISVAIATKFDAVIVNGGLTFTGKSAGLDFTNMTQQVAVDPTADRVAMYDASLASMVYSTVDDLIAGSSNAVPVTRNLTAGAGMTGGGDLSADRTFDVIAGTGITVAADSVSTDDSAIVHDNLSGFVADEHIAHSGVVLTAGVGLDGGGNIAASRTFDLGDTSVVPGTYGTATTVGAFIVDQQGRITAAGNIVILHDTLTGFVANEHINHAGVTLTAGTGLTGGGTIVASRTFDLDITGLTEMTVTPAFTDDFLYADGATMKKINFNQIAFPTNNDADNHAFTSTDVGGIRYFTGTTATWTMNSAIGQDDAPIVVINSGSGILTLASGTATLVTGANGLLLSPGGMAVLIRESSTVWFVGGTGLGA